MIKKLWPLLLICFLWFLFSKPFFIDNKVPFSSDFLVNFFAPWNAYPGFSSPVKNNATPDVITQIYPWKNLTIETFKSGNIPLWNPYSFSGTGQLANYQSAVLSPLNLLFFILPFIDAWSLLVLLQPLLAGLFMYLFLKSVNISKSGSIIGSISFMFCGFIVSWINYATLGYAILFLPLSLYFIEKFFQTNRNRYLPLLSISIPLSFFSGHFQISLYFFIFLCFYELFKLYQTKDLKKIINVIIYTFLGLLMSFPQILPSIEAYQQSLRSEIFQKTESIPWNYLVTFLAPDFLGNPVTRNDWFGHYAEWNGYIGLLPLVLSLISIIYRKNKTIIFFTLSAVVAILLSFNSPILDLIVYLKIPVLSTSAASRAIVIYSFSLAVLAAFGLDSLIEIIKVKKYKLLAYTLGLVVAIFVALWLIILTKSFIPVDKIIIAKQNLILPSILIALFIVITTILILLRDSKKSIYLKIFVTIILLIVSFDLLRFSSKWLSFNEKNIFYPNVPIVSEFKKINNYDRIESNLGGEATIYYKLSSLDGYDAVYNKRYGEFMSSLKNGDLGESSRSVVVFPKYGRYSDNALNLLGVKYVLFKVADGHSAWTYPFWNKKDGTFTLIYNDGVYQLLQNNLSFPRIFLVNKYSVKKDPQDIISRMFEEKINLRNEIVLEKNLKISLNAKNMDASIKKYSSNNILINTKSDGKALLFLSDAYYPGWNAYIDGVKTEILRADYAFRAVVVPSGEHVVKFSYQPSSFNLGIIVFSFSVLTMIILMILKRI